MRWTTWLVIACASAGWADVVIQGPTQIESGRSVVLVVPADQSGEKFAWRVEGSPAFITSNDETGKRLALLDVESDVFIVFVSWDLQKLDTHLVKVGKAPPDDKPRPLPGPNGKYGLANASAAWVVSHVPAAARSKCAALATSFRTMAKTIETSQAAGVAWDRDAMMEATAAQNADVLGDQREAWVKWATSLMGRLDELAASKSLVSADDYKQAFVEIAIGLESVK